MLVIEAWIGGWIGGVCEVLELSEARGIPIVVDIRRLELDYAIIGFNSIVNFKTLFVYFKYVFQ